MPGAAGHTLTDAIKRYDRELVFPRKDGRKPVDVRYAWEPARAAAELTDFEFHDLRHSTASYLAMRGASLGYTQDLCRFER